MRILEQAMEAWGVPELRRQLDIVQKAFSQDISQPFVLKEFFPNARQDGNQSNLPHMRQQHGPGIAESAIPPDQQVSPRPADGRKILTIMVCSSVRTLYRLVGPLAANKTWALSVHHHGSLSLSSRESKLIYFMLYAQLNYLLSQWDTAFSMNIRFSLRLLC